MQNLEVSIGTEVIEQFADVVVVGFLVGDLDQIEIGESELAEQMNIANRELAEQDINIQSLASEARIKDWRDAYAKIGLKPGTYKSSAEQIARRVIRDGHISTPIPAVTLYCAISCRHLAPMGGYDLERLERRIVELRRARPERDSFDPLGGRREDFELKESVVVYATGNEVICYAFNHRDSRVTSLVAHTRNAAFLGEAISARQLPSLMGAMTELRDFIKEKGCRVGFIEKADKNCPRISLSMEHGSI